MKTNMVGWFEIPVRDMQRAKKFYDKVFDIEIQIHDLQGTLMGWFPFAEDPEAKGAGGALIQNEKFYKPSTNGTLIYFSSPEITTELSKIAAAGGQVLQEKTLITEAIGYMALFLDTEGNRIALHSKA
ncbi:MAG: VOC family protein [Flavobacteriaceae bacterium]|nr:VOC family protein [Flavobacteriaceae bacterium]